MLSNQAEESASPKVVLFLDKLPGAGMSGTFTISLTVLDGEDASRDGQERQLDAGLTLNWQASDSGLTVSAPSQTLSVRFTEGGTSLLAEVENAEPRAISLRPLSSGRYRALLELDLLSLFTSELPANIPIEDYFDPSDAYNIKVEIQQEGQSQFFYEGSSFDSLLIDATIVDVSQPQLPDNAWNISKPSAEIFPGLSNLPLSTGERMIDLPDQPIALAFPKQNAPDNFLTAVPILYGETAVVEPPDLSSDELEALENSRLYAPSEADSKIPSLFLILEKTPEASDTVEIELKLFEGQDAIYDQGEIFLGANMLIEWGPNAQSSDLTFAASKLTLYVVDSESCAVEDGSTINLGDISANCQESISNFDPEIASFLSLDNGLPPIIEIRLANLLFASSRLEMGPVKEVALSSAKEWRLVAAILGSESSIFLEDQPIRAVELLLSQ